jgi:hypothetical protein
MRGQPRPPAYPTSQLTPDSTISPMPDPAHDVEARLAVLEREVARLRDQAVRTSSDAAAARADAAGASFRSTGAPS